MLWHSKQIVPNGNWGEFVKFSKQKVQQIAVGQNKDERLEVFAIDDRNDVLHSAQKNTKW